MGDAGSGWASATASALTREHIDALLTQEISYVRVPAFLQTDWCAEISRRFLAFMETHPDHRVHLQPTSTIDVILDAVALPMNYFAQFRPVRMEEYLSRVPQDAGLLRGIYQGGKDPLASIRGFWDDAGWQRLPAMEGTRPYHTDVLWGTLGGNKTPPHVDTYHIEARGSLSRFSRRFSCNTFIQAPESGGAFRVYRRRREDPDAERTPLEAAPMARYEVTAGDLVVFDAGNYHAVEESFGSRHRLVAHMAVGLDPASRECSLFA